MNKTMSGETRFSMSIKHREDMAETLAMHLFEADLALNSLIMEQLSSLTKPPSESKIPDLKRELKSLARDVNKFRNTDPHQLLANHAAVKDAIAQVKERISMIQSELKPEERV